MQGLEQWLRRRLRAAVWKQWKYGRRRFAELRKQGVNVQLAAKTAGSAHGPWHLANSTALTIALPNAYFDSLSLPRLVASDTLNPPNRRMRTRMSGGVAGARG
jgi:RNA-directed DNA polymerase